MTPASRSRFDHRLLLDGEVQLPAPGSGRQLARILGVHPSTICRDIRAIFDRHRLEH